MFHRNKLVRIASTLVPAAAAVSVLGFGSSANAQISTTVFSNNSTYAGYFTPTGATAGNLFTYTDASLINLQAYSTGAITKFTASAVNANTAAVTVTPIFSFYSVSATGTPGTLIGTISFGSTTFNAQTIYTLTETASFTVPSSFWAAETFTSTTATATQLNSVGQAIYGPATIGTGGTTFFQGSTAGAYNTSNPAGGLYTFNGGLTPNFEFSFTGLSNAPEPSAVALALSGAMLTVGGMVRRRRAAKA